MSDNVNHPSHYADKGIEVIDYIRDTLPPSGFVDYCLGNVLKYVSRWRKKGGVEDLKKAQVYLNWAVLRAEENPACMATVDHQVSISDIELGGHQISISDILSEQERGAK